MLHLLYQKFLFSGVGIKPKREVSESKPNFGDKIFQKREDGDELLDRITYIKRGPHAGEFEVGKYPDVVITSVRALNFGDVKGEVQDIRIDSKSKEQPVYAKINVARPEEVRMFFEVYGHEDY